MALIGHHGSHRNPNSRPSRPALGSVVLDSTTSASTLASEVQKNLADLDGMSLKNSDIFDGT
jgi:hypothetical protein